MIYDIDSPISLSHPPTPKELATSRLVDMVKDEDGQYLTGHIDGEENYKQLMEDLKAIMGGFYKQSSSKKL